MRVDEDEAPRPVFQPGAAVYAVFSTTQISGFGIGTGEKGQLERDSSM